MAEALSHTPETKTVIRRRFGEAVVSAAKEIARNAHDIGRFLVGKNPSSPYIAFSDTELNQQPSVTDVEQQSDVKIDISYEVGDSVYTGLGYRLVVGEDGELHIPHDDLEQEIAV